jgi:hypothetical protein
MDNAASGNTSRSFPSPTREAANLAAREPASSGVGANVDESDERPSLVAVGEVGDVHQTLEARWEVAFDCRRALGKIYRLSLPILDCEADRHARETTGGAPDVAEDDRCRTAKDVDRKRELWSHARRQAIG